MLDEQTKLFYAASRAYLDAVRMVTEHREAHGRRGYLVLPTHMLIGLSIETGLKTILHANGFAPEKLRRPGLGHDLASLFEQAIRVGFSCNAGVTEIINHIASDYRRHAYRYPLAQSEVSRVHELPAVQALDKFVSEVAAFVGLPPRPPAPDRSST